MPQANFTKAVNELYFNVNINNTSIDEIILDLKKSGEIEIYGRKKLKISIRQF